MNWIEYLFQNILANNILVQAFISSYFSEFLSLCFHLFEIPVMWLICRQFNIAGPNQFDIRDRLNQDPSLDGDRQFYENLPFHGIQSPLNKVGGLNCWLKTKK